MDKYKEIAILLKKKNLIDYDKEVISLSNPDTELLNSVYREISEASGTETALEIYQLFKGQQVTFPVRFFNPAYIHRMILEEYDGSNVSEMAKKYNYSEKTIRRIIKNKGTVK